MRRKLLQRKIARLYTPFGVWQPEARAFIHIHLTVVTPRTAQSNHIHFVLMSKNQKHKMKNKKSNLDQTKEKRRKKVYIKNVQISHSVSSNPDSNYRFAILIHNDMITLENFSIINYCLLFNLIVYFLFERKKISNKTIYVGLSKSRNFI